MVRTGPGIAIGHPAYPPTRGDERVFGDDELGAAYRGGIIRQRQAAQVHRRIGRVEQFEPIVAGSRVGHPLVDHQTKRVAERCSGRIFRGGSRLVEQPPFAGALADRLVGNLETVLDRICHEAVGVDEEKSPALCRERKAGVCGTRRTVAVAQHHEVAALGQASPCGKRPTGAIRRTHNAHAIERHRLIRGIVNFHPVTGTGAIVREKLVEARAVKIRNNVWRTRGGATRELGALGAPVRQQALGHTGALALVTHGGKLDALGSDQRNRPALGRQRQVDMVGAGFHVEPHTLMAPWRDRGDAVQSADLLPHPDVQAGDECRGGGMRVVKLNPVTPALLRKGHPLVDDQRGRVGQGDRLVCRAKGWAAKRPTVVGTDDGSVDGTKRNGVHTATIGIKQRHRVSPLAKAKVGTNAVQIPRPAPDTQQARLAKRCPLGQRELVATAIAKHPALEVDLRLAKVSQLNEILLGAVRRPDMHLVDDHGRGADAGSRLARRTGLGRAGRPVGRRAGISQQIDQLQRMTVAVGQSWPGAAVAEVHLNHPTPVHVEQSQPLAAVGQAALVPAVYRQTGVAELEGIRIVVRCQHDVLAGGDRRVAVESVVDTVKPVPAKRHLGVATVMQLHEFVLTASRRVVHDLSKTK